MPVETIVEKTEQRDFSFFLDHGNFFKVVDTLEKFEANFVNKESQDGRDFVLFKRQLYQMYEVKHRSVWEHEQFSMIVERRNLKWLQDANRDFIMEIQRINYLDQMADITKLSKTKVFKRKFLNEDKVRGLVAWGGAAFGYMKLTTLSLMMGKFLPSAAITGAVMYGIMKWNDRNVVQDIELADDGQFKVRYHASMLRLEEVFCKPQDVFSLVALESDNMGRDDLDGNALTLEKWIMSGKDYEQPLNLILPADAFRSKQMMEWMMQKKANDEATNDDFHDLMRQRHEKKVSENNMSRLTAYHTKETGLAAFAKDNEMETQLQKFP